MGETCRVCLTLNVPEPLVERIRQACGDQATVEVLSAPARQAFRGAAFDDPDAAQAARRELDEALAKAEVLYGSAVVVPRDLYERAPKLRWIQVVNAGVDPLFARGLVNDRVAITNASGVHATPIGEWVLGAMLAFAKHFPQLARAQQRHQWARFPARELRGATCGVVGMGAIGSEVARLARAFGMRVVATRRSVTEPTTEDGVTLLPPSQLPRLLSESDYVVVAVPLTPETRPLIGAKEMGLMKAEAIVINIARGDVIDEAALIEALRDGHIGGAALDVFAKEPLPSDSPLWDMENVLISPHLSGSTPRYDERAVDIFCDNLRRFLAGEPLRNQIDPERGY